MIPILSFHTVENKTTAHCENFGAIFDQYAPMVYGMIFRAVKQETALAEKLTGEVFVYVYRNIDTYYPNKQRFGTWLIIITATLLKQHGYQVELLPVQSAKNK